MLVSVGAGVGGTTGAITLFSPSFCHVFHWYWALYIEGRDRELVSP